MVKIIKTNPDSLLLDNYFNTKANLGYYNMLTPIQRGKYLKQLAAISPYEYNRVMAHQTKEQLGLYAKRLDEIEKEIHMQDSGSLIPILGGKAHDRRQRLYNLRASLIKQAENTAGAEVGRFGNAYVSQRSSAQYVEELQNMLALDTVTADSYKGYVRDYGKEAAEGLNDATGKQVTGLYSALSMGANTGGGIRK